MGSLGTQGLEGVTFLSAGLCWGFEKSGELSRDAPALLCLLVPILTLRPPLLIGGLGFGVQGSGFGVV